MIMNKKDFESMRAELKGFEDKREKAIASSREIIKLSKLIIYSMHRNEFADAEISVKEIKKKIKELDKTKNYDTGISSVAFQEFVEAMTYYEFLKNKRIPSYKELEVNVENYLMGLCDLTGELVRKAVDFAINKRFSDVEKIRELVEEVYGEFLKLDLRNGELRKKSDAIKWNLRKLEDLVLSIKEFRVV